MANDGCAANESSPSIRRLNKQLEVDFATDVREGCSGKRKREPTRSVYEEAAVSVERDLAEKASKKKMRRANKQTAPKTPTKKPYYAYSADEQHTLMLNAATSLAQMGETRRQETASIHDKLDAAETTINLITKEYSDALLAAKDEAIRTATAALAAKEELVRVQAALIAIMQQNYAAMRE
jgi:hypothetical protein